LSGWIETLGVDASYKPPVVERPFKPVACFYVLLRNTPTEKPEYYRAIYIMQRTLKDFQNAIALKWNIEPTRILKTLHVLDRGLQVEIDDDVIRELSEGQDMIMEIVEVQNSEAQLKREWDLTTDNAAVDSDNIGGSQNVIQTTGVELRLTF